MSPGAGELDAISAGLRCGQLIPYLGPRLLDMAAEPGVPSSDEALVQRLGKGQPVPARIRRNLTAVAQYIENFRHRKVLRARLREIFDVAVAPTEVHRHLAAQTQLPLIVDTWYDDALLTALHEQREPTSWGQVQGLSRAEHRDIWTLRFHADGSAASAAEAACWATLIYKPIGCIRPDANFLISDSDYVEVFTEIDIQTPIPPEVQTLRQTRGFLFLGCRFATQVERSYARQIMKRSAGPHYALIDAELTRNEARFLQEQGIQAVSLSLADFAAWCAAPDRLEPLVERKMATASGL